MTRKELNFAGTLLLLAGLAGVGHGAWVVGSRSYTEDRRTVEGPEAVWRGWTLIAGFSPALAWAGLLFGPPVRGARPRHFALLGLAILGFVAVIPLAQPFWKFPWPPRTTAFYVQLGVYVVGTNILLFFGERGGIAGLGLLVAGMIALICTYGTTGFEGIGWATMAFTLIALHVAAGVWLAGQRPTTQ